MTAPKPFLQHLCERLLKSEIPLHKTAVVFPNRRAGLFLKKYLAKEIDKPTWLPRIYSLEEFLEVLSGKPISSNLEIHFALFKGYQKVYPKEKSFAEFLKWSALLLADFNDIDECLADEEKLFSALDQVKKLEEWNPGKKTFTGLQKKYLDFWGKLPFLYREYHKALAEYGFASRALLERKLSKENTFGELKKNGIARLVFAGFNALTEAECSIVKNLEGNMPVELYWDIDGHYLNNPVHEAGFGIRKTLKKLKVSSPEWVHSDLTSTEKDIYTEGCAGDIAQVKALGRHLEQHPEKYNNEKTAIVLANQHLAIPLLESMPEAINAFNISAGLPVKLTAVYQFWHVLFRALEQSARHGKGFYFKDLHELLNNEWLLQVVGNRPEIDLLLTKITEQNLVYISKNDFRAFKEMIGNPVAGALFPLLESQLSGAFGKDKIIRLQEVINSTIENSGPTGFTGIELEANHLLNQWLHHIHKALPNLGLPCTAENYTVLFDRLITREEISLVGEPLHGLQILGLLETRNLDFDHVFFLGANEGNLPMKANKETFIPSDIRRQFSLPSHHETDGIFAYHFYRAIQRAKSVHLFYNSLQGDFGGGEKSRFILQLELDRHLTNFNFHHREHSLRVDIPVNEPLVIEKDEVVLKKLKHYLQNQGLSPSAFNTYLGNPVEFYFRYVEQVYEENTIEEVFEASTFGDIVHSVLEDLYLPHTGNKLDREQLKKSLKDIPELTKQKIAEKTGGPKKVAGKNLLLQEVIIELIKKTVQLDLETKADYRIVELEKKMETSIDVNGLQVKLKGIADRIDITENTLRIIDYKTGRVNATELKVEDVEEVFDSDQYPKALQLTWYAYLYFKSGQYQPVYNVQSGIISVRSLGNGYQPLKIDNTAELDDKQFECFEKALHNCMELMLDPSVPFTENPEAEYPPFYEV